MRDGQLQSLATTRNFLLLGRVSPPSITLFPNTSTSSCSACCNATNLTVTAAAKLSITSATQNATIHYTLDGSSPLTSASRLTYGAGTAGAAGVVISVAGLSRVRVGASRDGMTSSYECAFWLHINPQASSPVYALTVAQSAVNLPGASQAALAVRVVMSSVTPNATIHYTTDGSTPVPGSQSSSQYVYGATGGVPVDVAWSKVIATLSPPYPASPSQVSAAALASTRIRGVAVAPGFANSVVSTTPQQSPAPGLSSGSSGHGVRARYLRVRLVGTGWLAFAELQAFTPDGTELKLAAVQFSSQLSTSSGAGVRKDWQAAATVDGDSLTCYARAMASSVGEQEGGQVNEWIVYEIQNSGGGDIAWVSRLRFDNEHRCNTGAGIERIAVDVLVDPTALWTPQIGNVLSATAVWEEVQSARVSAMLQVDLLLRARLPQPLFLPFGGVFVENVVVNVSLAANATISSSCSLSYTTDGSAPVTQPAARVGGSRLVQLPLPTAQQSPVTEQGAIPVVLVGSNISTTLLELRAQALADEQELLASRFTAANFTMLRRLASPNGSFHLFPDSPSSMVAASVLAANGRSSNASAFIAAEVRLESRPVGSQLYWTTDGSRPGVSSI